MVHPASLLISFLLNSIEVQQAGARSAQVYYLVAILFVLFWAVILLVYVVLLSLTDETGEPYQPYDDHGDQETLTRRTTRPAYESGRPERDASTSSQQAGFHPKATSLGDIEEG